MFNLPGEQHQKAFGKEQVERKTNQIGGDKFGVLFFGGGVVVRAKRPLAVPKEAVCHAENKRDGLRHKPGQEGKALQQKPENPLVNDRRRRADETKLDELSHKK